MAKDAPKRGRGRPPKDKKSTPKPATEIIRKPRRTDLPNAVEFPEGDNNKYTTFALAIMQFPKIDVRDPEQLQKRVFEYFQLCADHDMKPGVAAVGLAIGLDRRRMWEIRSGSKNVAIPQECKDIIIGVYDSLEALWESYMTNGKINPASGIFLGKNNFGYQDTQEYIVTPNAMNNETPVEVIEAKYDELPED
jgi:hypothetical protein